MCLISGREEFLVWVIFHYHHYCGHLVCKKAQNLPFTTFAGALFLYNMILVTNYIILYHYIISYFLYPSFQVFSFRLVIKMLCSSGSHLVPPEHDPAQQVGRQTELGGPVPLQCAGTERLRPTSCARLLSSWRPAPLHGRLSPAPGAIHYSSRMLEKLGREKSLADHAEVGLPVVPTFLTLPHARSWWCLVANHKHTHTHRECARVEDPTNLQLWTRAFFKIKVAFKCGRTIGRFCCHSSPQDCALTAKQAWSEQANSAPRWRRHTLA